MAFVKRIEGTMVPVGLVLKLLVLGFVLAAVIPVAVILFLNHEQTGDRIRDTKELVQRLNAERIARQQAINQFIFDQCVDAEVRDTVNVQTNLAIIRVLRPAADRPDIKRLIRSLEDSILALEPPGEKDCQPPPAAAP